jgi:membrane fusion protein (multidrug efflux system)
MKRGLLLTLVFLALAALTAGYGYFQFVARPAMIKGFITKMEPPPVTVAVEAARAETWQPKFAAIGTLRAVQGVDVAAQIGGIVRAVRFEAGQDAAKGMALVDIDDATEQADLKANLATLRNAELGLERQRQLVTGGNTSRANADAALATRDAAAAAAEKTRAIIAQKAVVAPFAGRLGIRKVDVGQYVAPGTALVTLQQLDPIYVDFPVPEQSIAQMQVGAAVEVTVDAMPGSVFKGAIVSRDARVSPDTRSLLVRAEVKNDARRLLPGMFANVEVFAGAPEPRITLPRVAVTYSLYGDSVYVVKPTEGDGARPGVFAVERRFVRTGDIRGDRVAILEGVQAGDRAVTQGQLKLQVNSRAVIDDKSPLTPMSPLPKE